MINPKQLGLLLRRFRGLSGAALGLFAAALASLPPVAHCQPMFPGSCAHLEAGQPSTPSGPASETTFDTTRIQLELDRCAHGQAVELTRSSDDRFDAFLIAPVRVPTGVTLLIDAGVTVYASRNPQDFGDPADAALTVRADDRPCGSLRCEPLIRITSGSGEMNAGLMGYGVLDGRGDVLLFETRGTARRTWYDVGRDARPVLVEASGPVTLRKITLRNAGAVAVHHDGGGDFLAEGVKIISPPYAGDTLGIVLDDGAGTNTLLDVSVSTAATDVVLATVSGLRLRNLAFYSGTGVLPGETTNNHCLVDDAATTRCVPANLPLLAGELFLSTADATNLQTVATAGMLTLNAVLIAPDSEMPAPDGVVSFFAEDRLLGTAELKGGLARLSLQIAEAGTHHIHARYSPTPGAAATFSFGAVEVYPSSHAVAGEGSETARALPIVLARNLSTRVHPAAGGLAVPVLALSEAQSSAPYGVSVALTAEISPSTATGSVSFVDSVAGILGQSALADGRAVLGTPLLAAGSHEITAIYAGDASNTIQTSGSVTLAITPATPGMTLGPSPSQPVVGSSSSITIRLLDAGTPAIPLRSQQITSGLNETTEFMGDSIFAWWTVPLHNDGIPGQTAAMMLARFSQQALDHGYERVILLAGTNDILHTGNDAATTLASVRAMADLATTAGLPIALCTILDIDVNGVDMSSRVEPLNAAIRGFAAERHYPLIDFHAAFAGHPEWRSDGIHPTADGYAAMEAAVAQTLLFPTGTVSLGDGTTATLSSTGTATLPLSTLQGGLESLVVSFSGDHNFAPTSGTLTVDVAPAPTTTTLQVQAESELAGGSAGLTAKVIGLSGTSVTGSVFFRDGGQALGSASVSATGGSTLTISGLTKGLHTFSATYSGDVNYEPSSSSPSLLTELGRLSSIALSSSATTFISGSPAVVSASVLPTNAAGTVTFLDGAHVLGQAPLEFGTATFTTRTLLLGRHAMTAAYSGDTINDGAQSGTLNLEVDAGPTAVTLASLPTNIAYGTPVAISASLVPATATGTLVFHDHFLADGRSAGQSADQIVGQSIVVNGAGSASLRSLPVGTHLLTAVYSGDTADQPAVSGAASMRVDALASAVLLSSRVSGSGPGAMISFDASVIPASATGSISFVDGPSGALGQVTLVSGVAHSPLFSLSPGLHTVTAFYSGDSVYSSSASPALRVQIESGPSSITIVPFAAAVEIGSSSLLTANVSPASATGSVVFRDAGTGVLGESVLLHGTAQLAVGNLAAGTYSISASYSGDLDHGSAQSAGAPLQVGLRSTRIVMTPLAGSISFGSPLTLRAVVTPASLSGLVNFFDTSSGPVGSATLVNGSAGLSVSTLAVGPHAIRAVFAGDDFNSTATSPPSQVIIAAAATAVTVSLSQAAVIAGGGVVVNVQVTAAASTVPSGSVLVRSGGQLLGTISLTNASAGSGYASLSIDTAALRVGEFAISAFYLGDADHMPSDSAAKPHVLTILPVPTTAVLSLPTSRILVQTSTMVTASVSTPSAGVVPTGAISFSNNGMIFATVALDSSGSSSAAIPAMAAGTYTLMASYVATGNFANASASPQVLTVTLPVALSLTPAYYETKPNSSFTSAVALTPLTGFHGPIRVRCISPVAWITCNVNGPTSLDGSELASAPVEVHVDKDTEKSYAQVKVPRSSSVYEAVVALLLPFLLKRRWMNSSALRALRAATSFLAISASMLMLSGCTLGGNLFEIQNGVQTIIVAVDVSGMTIATELRVNLVR